MGDTITGTLKHRLLVLGLLSLSIIIALIMLYPYAKNYLHSYSISYYHYTPSFSIESLSPAPTKPVATGVPILMYHGVTDKKDDTNTTLPNFIAQMEMLKKNGYITISITDYDNFRQGKFTLPAKPVIITFDDGRKDSYYPTDDIFKKLGFKATIFVATGPTYDGNSFYLNWDELKTMASTSRWEIEAHGRYSHHRIAISKDTSETSQGRYLTSKMYLPKQNRVETTAEFEKRVDTDYINGVKDLMQNVGVKRPQYFAIPLNDYGQQPLSNYVQAVPFNQSMIKKYFRLAFIQANQSDNPLSFRLEPYNFKNEDPYLIKRIEVENINAAELKSILEKYAPTIPYVSLKGQNLNIIKPDADSRSGTVTYAADGLHLAATNGRNGQILYGETYWQNYSVAAILQRRVGRSVGIPFYYQDSKNYLAFGLTDNGYFLRSTVNGTTRDLVPSYITSESNYSFTEFKVTVKNRLITCYINGQPIFQNIYAPLQNGMAGMRTWGDNSSEGVLQSFEVRPL
jgi:peptidoglycan/xylan/chitin deacetylase (PgdA/CDA1 family)